MQPCLCLTTNTRPHAALSRSASAHPLVVLVERLRASVTGRRAAGLVERVRDTSWGWGNRKQAARTTGHLVAATVRHATVRSTTVRVAATVRHARVPSTTVRV